FLVSEASMVQIKESIELLLKILHSFGFSRMKAETFRLAKFNEPGAVKELWRLLFETIYYVKYGDVDEVCVRASTSFTSQELVVFLKRELTRLGFYCRDFDLLPEDQSSGSRELLLAFGWLACKETLLQRFARQLTSPLDFEHFEQSDSFTRRQNGASQGEAPVSGLSGDVCNDLKQLVWLNGKLRMTLKQLQAATKAGASKAQAVAAASGGRRTPLELFLARHPDMLSRNLQLLERDNERLQCLLRWKDFEEEFWLWMESVLDLKVQEAEAAAADYAESFEEGGDTAATAAAPETTSTSLTEAHKRLHDSLVKYECIAELLETQWRERSLRVSPQELDLMIGQVDREIGHFAEHYERLAAEPECPAAYYAEHSLPAEPGQWLSESLIARMPEAESKMEREIQRLESVLAKLEFDVEKNYSEFKTDLQTASRQNCDSLLIFDPVR
ncbi:hypothetical protein BOX15_Mlig023687g1, partial [Macrostomum lignano]